MTEKTDNIEIYLPLGYGRPVDGKAGETLTESMAFPLPAGRGGSESSHPRPRAGHLDEDLTYRRILGEEAWTRLPPGTRRRFSCKPRMGTTHRYHGVMRVIHVSRAGAVIANLLRVIGMPLPPYRGERVPVVIELARHPSGGIAWSREYAFEGRRRLRIRSVKLAHDRDRLLEVVGGGVGMVLEVFEHRRVLHFLSVSFFWRLGPLRIPIPQSLTPGRTHVLHRDEGQGRFRFTMRIEHPILGLTFYQDGLFSEAQVH